MVMMANHRHAAAGWRHDIIIRLEDAQKPLGERPGIRVQAGIRQWLAAAGLRFGKVHFDLASLQHLDRSQSDVWIELVDVAGNKKADAHFRSFKAAPVSLRSGALRRKPLKGSPRGIQNRILK